MGLKLASLLVALLLWFHVQSQALLENKVSLTFTLDLINVPTDMVAKAAKPTVQIDVTGLPDDIKNLYKRLGLEDSPDPRKARPRLRALVDLSNAQPGVLQVRPIVPRQEQYPDLNLVWERPPMVTILVEKIETKNFPVTVDAIRTPPGFVLSREDVSPEQVQVSGSKEDLADVSSIRAQVDLKDFKPGDVYKQPVYAFNKANRLLNLQVDPSEVKVLPALTEALTRKNVLITPTWKGEPAFGCRVKTFSVTPNQVLIRGNDTEQISRMAAIDTEPVDITGATRSLTKQVHLRLPRGIHTKQTSVRVEVVVEGTPTAQLPPSSPPISANTEQ